MWRDSWFWVRAFSVLLRHRWLLAPQSPHDGGETAAALILVRIRGRSRGPALVRAGGSQGREAPSGRPPQERSRAHRGGTAPEWSSACGPRAPVLVRMRDEHWLVVLVVSRRRVLCCDPTMGIVNFGRDVFRRQVAAGVDWRPRAPAEHRAEPDPDVGRSSRRSGAAESARPRNPWRHDVAGVLVGAAARISESAIVAVVCLVLFFVQDRVTVSSYLIVAALGAAAAVLLLGTRLASFAFATESARQRESNAWRSLVRLAARGCELPGPRGQPEHVRARELRGAVVRDVGRRGGDAAAVGATAAAVAVLGLLHPLLALLFAGVGCLLGLSMVLDRIYLAEDSLDPARRSYRRLTQSVGALHPGALTVVAGETVKWTVIVLAGLMLLAGQLTDVAAIFWVLTALLVIPRDVQLASTTASAAIRAGADVFGAALRGVPPRRVRIDADCRFQVDRNGAMTRITGMDRLTAAMRRTDLNATEQRRIVADAVTETLGALAEDERPDPRALRIFGLGAPVSWAEVEQVTLDNSLRGARIGRALPSAGTMGTPGTGGAVQVGRRSLAAAETNGVRPREDSVTLALRTCEARDVPVFWQARGRIDFESLRATARDAGVRQVVLIDVDRLTLVEASDE